MSTQLSESPSGRSPSIGGLSGEVTSSFCTTSYTSDHFRRPSYYLNSDGLCRNPARLANDLLTGLKDHGYIEQAENQAAAFNIEEESDDS